MDWSKISVFVTAALLKDFLRSLPDCLLQSDNYNSWMHANTAEDIKALNRYVFIFVFLVKKRFRDFSLIIHIFILFGETLFFFL